MYYNISVIIQDGEKKNVERAQAMLDKTIMWLANSMVYGGEDYSPSEQTGWERVQQTGHLHRFVQIPTSNLDYGDDRDVSETASRRMARIATAYGVTLVVHFRRKYWEAADWDEEWTFGPRADALLFVDALRGAAEILYNWSRLADRGEIKDMPIEYKGFPTSIEDMLIALQHYAENTRTTVRIR